MSFFFVFIKFLNSTKITLKFTEYLILLLVHEEIFRIKSKVFPLKENDKRNVHKNKIICSICDTIFLHYRIIHQQLYGYDKDEK